jgi:hypothetical protein
MGNLPSGLRLLLKGRSFEWCFGGRWGNMPSNSVFKERGRVFVVIVVTNCLILTFLWHMPMRIVEFSLEIDSSVSANSLIRHVSDFLPLDISLTSLSLENTYPVDALWNFLFFFFFFWSCSTWRCSKVESKIFWSKESVSILVLIWYTLLVLCWFWSPGGFLSLIR